MITASVIAVTARRAVQLMPRPTHHSSAQLITTGTMISSCNARHPVAAYFCWSMISGQTLRVCPEGKPVSTFPDHALAGATDPDAGRAADLHAGLGAPRLDETRTIGST